MEFTGFISVVPHCGNMMVWRHLVRLSLVLPYLLKLLSQAMFWFKH
jgi:hypothetical protein